MAAVAAGYRARMVLLAVGSGAWIFIIVLLVILGGIIYGFFTRSGSGISDHPHDGEGSAPGAKGPSEPSGKDQGESSALSDHGNR